MISLTRSFCVAVLSCLLLVSPFAIAKDKKGGGAGGAKPANGGGGGGKAAGGGAKKPAGGSGGNAGPKNAGGGKMTGNKHASARPHVPQSMVKKHKKPEYCIGLYKEAIYDIDQSVKLDDFNRFAFSLKGDCLFELDEFDKAIEAYSKAIRLSPQDDHSYFWRGQCYLQKQNADLAKRDLVLACELNPENCPENQVDDDDEQP